MHSKKFLIERQSKNKNKKKMQKKKTNFVSLIQLPYTGYDVRLMPLCFAFGIDTLLALRYAKVVMTGGCGKNGSSVAVRIQKKKQKFQKMKQR